MKSIHDLIRDGHSIRWVAKTLGLSRNSVRKYVREPGLKKYERKGSVSRLDPFKPYLLRRFQEDAVTNGAVLLREVRAQGYEGGRSILCDFLKTLRLPRVPKAPTERFETDPGEQAQVDFKTVTLVRRDGTTQRLLAFVMVLSWSRAMYVEFIQTGDLGSFIRCHLRAFRHFGGVPRRVLYDNMKLVVLARRDGEPVWTERFLDFSLRLGFELRLCRPYRPQTKGKVERAIRYVQDNFLPTARPVDIGDLNRQALEWCTQVADVRVHGTTLERPIDRLAHERESLRTLPQESRLVEFQREDRRVARDGFVAWGGCHYGVHCSYALQVVQVDADDESVTIWQGDARLAVHPRGSRRGQRFRTPGQWAGLRADAAPSRKQAIVRLVDDSPVEVRSLSCYEAFAQGVA